MFARQYYQDVQGILPVGIQDNRAKHIISMFLPNHHNCIKSGFKWTDNGIYFSLAPHYGEEKVAERDNEDKQRHQGNKALRQQGIKATRQQRGNRHKRANTDT